MPHSIREEHLEDICAQCKKPHGNSIVIEINRGKLYEIITCQNCGYEIIRTRPEEEVTDRLVIHTNKSGMAMPSIRR
jgi:DNA-directed RNA polymerase subunit RPC12/RpoP